MRYYVLISPECICLIIVALSYELVLGCGLYSAGIFQFKPMEKY